MRADAKRDGRPAEYRWRPLAVQRRRVWLTSTAEVPWSNTAKMRNRLKLAGVPETTEPISAASGPKVTILWGHLEEILLLKAKFHYAIWLEAGRRPAASNQLRTYFDNRSRKHSHPLCIGPEDKIFYLSVYQIIFHLY